MGYIDDNLVKRRNNRLPYKTAWVIYRWPVIFALLGLSFMVGGMKDGWIVATGLFALAIGTAVSAYITLKTSEFGITNRRVLIKVGFIKRDSLETILTKVEGIHVQQGVLGGY